MNPAIRSVLLLCLLIASSIVARSQSITAIDPDNAWQGQTIQVSVSGTGLTFLGGTGTTVWLTQGGDEIIGNTTNSVPTEIQSNIHVPQAAPTGFYNVFVGDYGVNSVQLTNGFEVTAAPELLDPPQLILPANTANLVSNPVTIQWSSVAGAVNYEYQISHTSNFQSVVFQGTTSGTSATTSVLNGAHYWRVRTGNVVVEFGAWSSVFEFTMQGPSSLTSINPNQAFQGQMLPVTVSGVNVQFSQSTGSVDFSLLQGVQEIPFFVIGTTTPNGSNMDFVGNGDLQIPINAPTGLYDLSFTDPNSQNYLLPQSFTVLPEVAAPSIPDLISPIGGIELNNGLVAFDWTDENNAAEYEFQVNTSTDFTDPLFYLDEIEVSNQTLNLYGGVYYWRIRANSISGNFSAWSNPATFDVVGVSQITSLDPNEGYAGQSGLSVQMSGVNLPFMAASGTVPNVWLDKNGFTIDASGGWVSSPSGGDLDFDIPLNAPVGYYDVHYEPEPFAPLSLQNAFYVTEGNEISGHVYVDNNLNQVFDSGDIDFPFISVLCSPGGQMAVTDDLGMYSAHVPSGSHEITLPLVNLFNVLPQSHSFSFSGSGVQQGDLDFALQPIPGLHDMMVSLNAGIIRSGRNMNLTVTVRNMGPSVESGQFSVTIPEGMAVVSASDPGYTLNGNQINWPYTNVGLLEESQVDIVLFTPLTIEVGEILSFSAEVSDVATDVSPSDNVYLLDNQVVNSYDPNFKEVSPSTIISQDFVESGEFLNYTVHFQNTGTASALDVYVLDTISENLDLSSFQFVTASHDLEVNILDNRVVEFRFDGINLPDSTSNEPESHGFFSYRIEPLPTFLPLMLIQNTGYIYFDFNEPIITNTTENWIPTGIRSLDDKVVISVQPNPNNGRFRLNSSENGNYKIYDLIGNIVASGEITYQTRIDISSFGSGIHLLNVETEKGSVTQKLVVY